MTEILQSYEKEMARGSRPDETHCKISRFFNGFRIEVPPKIGTGWNEVLEIDSGLCLSLSDYMPHKIIRNSITLNRSPLRFNILLKGSLDFQLDSTARHRVCAGDIWVWNDLSGNIARAMHPGHEVCGVTITCPHHLVESWLGGASCDVSRNLETRQASHAYFPPCAKSTASKPDHGHGKKSLSF